MRLRTRSFVFVVAATLVAGATPTPGGAPVSASGTHAVAPSPATQSVGEATSTYQFHVRVSPAPHNTAGDTHDVAVDFAISGSSTATCNTDYTVTGVSNGTAFSGACPSPQGTLIFDAGDDDETINFAITNDTANEGNESVVINLFNARCLNGTGPQCTSVTPGMTPITGQLQITDNDVATFTVADASASEGDPVPFSVSLAPPPGLGQTASVTCTHDTSFAGTATPATDFDAAARTITFNPGDTTVPCSFPTVEDATEEPNETFRIKLTGAAGTGGYPTATATDTADGTIVNDDGASAVVPKASVGDASANEGDAVQFTVTLSDACPTGTTATIPFDTRSLSGGAPSGSASESSDYARTQGTVVFTGAEKTKTVSVGTTEDTTTEPDETFSLFLGTPTGTCAATVTDGEAVGTIRNDDGPSTPPTPNVQITIGSRRVKEGDDLTRPCFLPVTLSVPATQTVTVKYATADGTATEDSDYAKNSGTLTFTPGVIEQRVEITVFGDTINDQGRRETVLVNLSSPTGATISDARGKCKIYEGRRP